MHPPPGSPPITRLAQIAAALALFSSAPLASVAAQQSAQLAAGERVRVVVATGRQALYTGTVATLRGDTLVLNRRNSEPMAFPLASVGRVERSLGRGRCGGAGARAACMLGGALAGMLIGGGIGYSATRDGSDISGMGVIAGAPVGLIVGLVVGGLVGGERWQRIR